MWKEKLPLWLKNNLGICIGALIGLLIFIFGFPKMLTLVVLVGLGMIIGHAIQKNGKGIKETLKSFIDKL